MCKKGFTINLTLFGETGGAAAGSEAGLTGGGNADAGQNRADKADVVYGKPPVHKDSPDTQDAVDGQGKGQAPENREAEFEGLIKGKYRDVFHNRVQEIIDKRFRETRDLEAKMKDAQPLLEIMAGKYGVDASDMKALSKAVQEDTSYFEQEAAEKGVPVETLKEMKRLERENAAFKAAREARERQEQAQRVYGDWMKQAEQLKTVYPSFDFAAETRNPQFLSLLKAPGVDVRTAYEVIHRDEILGGAMQHTAQTVAQKVVNDIAARGTRPQENGTAGQSAVVFKSDVNKLTKADRAEILKRVARGERIEF